MTSRVLGGVFAIGAAFAFVAVGAFGAPQHAHSAIQLHATMSTAKQVPLPAVKAPRAQGLFTASLTVRTLSWQLTYHGLSGAALRADLHIGAKGQPGPVALRLCAPCQSGAHGTATLAAATAQALTNQAAYVDIRTRKNPRGEIRGQITSAIVPTLQVLSPKDGETVTPPTAVRYTVTGYTLGQGDAHIVAFVGSLTDRISVDLQAGNQPGLAYLPADKRLSGRRDLTFALVKADGSMLANPEARSTVYNLTIQGGR